MRKSNNLTMKPFSNKSGFTLIELIVVIAVIGILAGLIVVRIGSANQDARNSRREADLNQMKNAIQQWQAMDGGAIATTPPCSGTDDTARYTNATNITAVTFLSANNRQPTFYLANNAWPAPPLAGGTQYRYCYFAPVPGPPATPAAFVFLILREGGGVIRVNS